MKPPLGFVDDMIELMYLRTLDAIAREHHIEPQLLRNLDRAIDAVSEAVGEDSDEAARIVRSMRYWLE